LRHDEGNAGVAAGTDGAEHIGVLVTLILGLARPRSLLGPLIDEAVLLADRISSWNQTSIGVSGASLVTIAATCVGKFL